MFGPDHDALKTQIETLCSKFDKSNEAKYTQPTEHNKYRMREHHNKFIESFVEALHRIIAEKNLTESVAERFLFNELGLDLSFEENSKNMDPKVYQHLPFKNYNEYIEYIKKIRLEYIQRYRDAIRNVRFFSLFKKAKHELNKDEDTLTYEFTKKCENIFPIQLTPTPPPVSQTVEEKKTEENTIEEDFDLKPTVVDNGSNEEESANSDDEEEEVENRMIELKRGYDIYDDEALINKKYEDYLRQQQRISMKRCKVAIKKRPFHTIVDDGNSKSRSRSNSNSRVSMKNNQSIMSRKKKRKLNSGISSSIRKHFGNFKK